MPPHLTKGTKRVVPLRNNSLSIYVLSLGVKDEVSQALVVQASNPSYLGG
jgi:hypothetical protein